MGTVGASKTDAGSGRVIPLNEVALATLKAWATNFPDRKQEHYVFPSEHYGLLATTASRTQRPTTRTPRSARSRAPGSPRRPRLMSAAASTISGTRRALECWNVAPRCRSWHRSWAGVQHDGQDGEAVWSHRFGGSTGSSGCPRSGPRPGTSTWTTYRRSSCRCGGRALSVAPGNHGLRLPAATRACETRLTPSWLFTYFAMVRTVTWLRSIGAPGTRSEFKCETRAALNSTGATFVRSA